MNSIDLGGDSPPLPPGLPEMTAPVRGVRIETVTGDRLLHILCSTTARFGRHSAQDFPLRMLPTEDAANRDATFRISSSHFLLRYLANRVEVMDVGSTGGTMIEPGHGLVAKEAVELKDSQVISVADTLRLEAHIVPRNGSGPAAELVKQVDLNAADTNWLDAHLVGPNSPGMIEFIRLRRLNNAPEHEYVMLFGKGLIGSGKDSLIEITREPSKRTSRGLDLGDADGADAALFWTSAGITFEAKSSDVSVNGGPLEPGGRIILGNGFVLRVRDHEFRANLLA